MSSFFYQPTNPGWGNAATYAKRRPTTNPTSPTSPATPATPQMTAEEWIRQQTAKYVQAQIDAVNAQKEAYLRNLQARSDLEMRRGQELAAALQALNIPGRMQSIYGNAAADIGGLAQGFSGAVRDSATAGASQQQRMLSGTGQEGAVPNTSEAQGNVTYGLGGYIPGRSMTETGAAFAAQAALEPGFAQRIGQVKASDAYSAGLEGLKQFTDAILEIEGKRPQIEMDLTEQYRKAQADPQAIHLADGRIQWFDKNTGAPLSKPFGPKRSSSSGVKTVRLANGTYQAVVNGKPVGKPFGPPKAEGGTATLKTVNQGNQVALVDPYTGAVVKTFPKVSLAKASSGVTKYKHQGTVYRIDRNGNIVGATKLPGTDSSTGGSKRKPTAKQLQTWGQYAKQSYKGYFALDADNDTAIPFAKVRADLAKQGLRLPAGGNPQQIAQALQGTGYGYFQRSYQESMSNLLNEGASLETAQRLLNRWWTKPGDTRTGFDPRSGRPKKTYQQRQDEKQGGGFTIPKPGGGWGGSFNLASWGKDIARANGLSVISEKRDTKHTASGGVSDHWSGSGDAYAFDLSNGSAPTEEMDRTAMQIVAALGGSYDGKSELVQNFYRNGYRLQILYRTNVGGNHFNHIHFGVRKA